MNEEATEIRQGDVVVVDGKRYTIDLIEDTGDMLALALEPVPEKRP